MHPEKMSSDNSSPRYTIFNFAKVSVRHRGIAPWLIGLKHIGIAHDIIGQIVK